MKKRIIYNTIWVLLLLPVLGSCIKDNADRSVDATGDDATVLITMMIPGGTGTATRTMTEVDENMVTDIDVLVFRKNGNYYTTAEGRSIVTTGPNTKTFEISIREGIFDIIVLANCRKWIAENYPTGIPGGTPITTIKRALYASCTGKWITDTADTDFIPIPMVGSQAIEIRDDGRNNDLSGIFMTKMTARVDVMVGDAAKPDFQLLEVLVYNAYDKGVINPVDDDTKWDSGYVTEPNLNATWTPVPGPITYSGAEITETGVASKGNIYLFESPRGTREYFTDNTCLVIGGMYDGKKYYYRADFGNNNGGVYEYIPVLRNHRYDFTIKSVSGPGFEDPDDAFNSLPFNMDIEVLEWHDGHMSNVAVEGEYYLYIDPIDMYGWMHPTWEMSITTNHPGGWEYTVTYDEDYGGEISDWIYVYGRSYNSPGIPDYLSFQSSYGNNIVQGQPVSTDPTIAYITITAGETMRVTAKVELDYVYVYYQQYYSYNQENHQPSVLEKNHIDILGDTRTVQVMCMLLEDLPVRAYDMTNRVVLDQTVVNPGSRIAPYDTIQVTLNIPPYTGSDEDGIIVGFEFWDDMEKQWKLFETRKQGENRDFIVELRTRREVPVPDSINVRGDTLLFHIAGVYPELQLRTELDGATYGPVITVPAGNTEQWLDTRIEPNASWDQRSFNFQYSIDNGTTWQTFTMKHQQAYRLWINTSLSYSIYALGGQNYFLFNDSVFDQIEVRVLDREDDSVVYQKTVVCGGPEFVLTTYTEYFNMPYNQGRDTRYYSAQYSVDGGTTWRVLSDNVPQAVAYYELSSGRYLAFQEYYTNTNWVQAIGLDNVDLDSDHPGGDVISSSSYYYSCNGGYSDTNFPAGSWFLPTKEELEEIIEIPTTVISLFQNYYYWSSTPYFETPGLPTDQAWAAKITSASERSIEAIPKSSTMYNGFYTTTRCVRY